jgi:hypothetical protein
MIRSINILIGILILLFVLTVELSGTAFANTCSESFDQNAPEYFQANEDEYFNPNPYFFLEDQDKDTFHPTDEFGHNQENEFNNNNSF